MRRWPSSRTPFVSEQHSLTDAVKTEARRQLKDPTLLEQLSRWWEKKYRLPSNHKLFQERTEEDLLVEFWVDVYEKNPLEADRGADGEVQLKNTGDPYIDKWEQEMADGLSPDLTEMFDPEHMAKFHRMRKQGAEAPRNLELQEAVDASNANHPVERRNRAHQEALATRMNPARDPSNFPGTFGDD